MDAVLLVSADIATKSSRTTIEVSSDPSAPRVSAPAVAGATSTL